MKYNEKYDVYIDDDLVIYRMNKNGKLIQRSISSNGSYPIIHLTNKPNVYVHRLVYETFVGEIPKGYQIDHINTIKTDYRIENLRLVTPKENMANPITRAHLNRVIKKRKDCLNGRKITPVEPKTEFNRKFREHYNMVMADDPKLYDKERNWYKRHNKKCRWENE